MYVNICILPLGIRPLHISSSHSTYTLFVPTKFGMSIDFLLCLGTAKILMGFLVMNFFLGGGGWRVGARGQTRCIMGDVKMENSQVKTEQWCNHVTRERKIWNSDDTRVNLKSCVFYPCKLIPGFAPGIIKSTVYSKEGNNKTVQKVSESVSNIGFGVWQWINKDIKP